MLLAPFDETLRRDELIAAAVDFDQRVRALDL
jgi:hypothetical protein